MMTAWITRETGLLAREISCVRGYSSNDFMCMDKSSRATEDVNKMLLSGGLLIVTLFAMGIGVLLVWFAVLREDQWFWTNAGGYPIWLRDLVHFTYLPCLAAMLLLLLALSMVCCAKICGSIRFLIIESMLLLTCWILVSVSGFIAFNNNVTNLFEGRKLHQKAPREPWSTRPATP